MGTASEDKDEIEQVMDGKAEAIKIVAREVGEKAFGVARQKLTRTTQEGR